VHKLVTLAAALAVLGAPLSAHGAGGRAEAQQRKQLRPPPQQPRVLRDRDRYYGPPQQPERNYYGPAPGIQQPMERVPMPPPLAQPPINR
jgi:hypothetical protein